MKFRIVVQARAVLVAGFFCMSGPLLAQQAILQGGPWKQGHAPMYKGQGSSQPVVVDSGTAGGGGIGVGLSELGITATGTGTAPYAGQGTGPYGTDQCNYDAPITNPSGGHYLCFSPNAQGGGLIAYGAFGTAPSLPLNIIVNGITYPFPGPGGGDVVGPNSSISGDIALFNGTTGTIIQDGGPPSYSVPNVAALRALPLTFRALGDIINVNSYASAGDAPLATYRMSTSACTLNAGAGDGGSQIPSATAGNCWIIIPDRTIDIRNWGAVDDWNPTIGTGTDNATAINAAIAYACARNVTTLSAIQVVQGKQPAGIASPIHITNCAGISWRPNLGALAASWDEGIATSKSFTYVMPNQANPSVTVSGIANPPNPWPSQIISSVTNNGGFFQVNLAGSLTTTTGQLMQITGATGLTTINGTWTVTRVSGSQFVLNGSVYSSGYTGSSGLAQGPLPVAMITIDGGSYAITLDQPIVNCFNRAGCVAVADYGVLQGASGDLNINDPQITNFKHFGVFIAGAGVKSNVCGGRIQQGVYSDITSRTGYPVYYVNAGDQQVGCLTELAYGFQNFFSDSQANDINFRGVHVYNGMGAAVGGPFYPAITGTFSGTGSFTGSTVDNGQIEVLCTVATCPYVQITGNFSELFGAGIVDAPIVYQTTQTGFGAASLPASTGIDPNQLASATLFQNLGSWLYKPTIVLEDATGNVNTSVWNARSLDTANGINNSTPAQARLNQNNAVGAASFTATGTPSNGSLAITGLNIFPLPGATVSDSAGFIPANAAHGAYNYAQGVLQFTTATAAATGNSTTDKITIGSYTFPASGSGTAVTTTGSYTVTGVQFPAIRKGIGVSGTCIPSGSWVDGFDWYAQTLVIDNAAHTAPSGCSGAETITFNPSAYTFQPDDDGGLFTLVGIPSASIPSVAISLPSLMPAGWNVQLGLQAVTLATLTPLGNATLNAGTTTYTLNAIGANVVTPLVANGTNSSAGTRYDVGNNGPLCSGGPIDSTVAGSENNLATCVVPGNSLGLSGCIQEESTWSTKSGAGNDTIMLRYAAAPGGTQYMTKIITSGGNQGYSDLRWICNAGATNVQTAIAASDNPFGFLTAAKIVGNVDTTAASSVFFNVTPGGGDVDTLNHYTVTLVPQSGR